MLRAPLIQKRKALARTLLYGSAVLLPTAAWWLAVNWSEPADVNSSWHRSAEEYVEIEAVRLFQEFLRIDTSYPDGNEIPGAEFLARQLEAAGIEVHLERKPPRNANLWAILEGQDPRALVLHNHIDIDRVIDPERWRHGPFAGEIEAPWIFGRGAFDMKSVTIAQLMAVLDLARSDVPLSRSVIFLATGDEETGSQLGAQWLIEHRPELIERFDAVLTEGGAVEAIATDDVKYWGTEFTQKRFVHVLACHHDRARLEMLARDLNALDRQAFSRDMTPMVARFMRRYAESRTSTLYQRLLSEPEALLDHPEFHRLPEYVQLMVRSDLLVLPVEADPAGGFRLPIVLGLLPGVPLDDVLDELLPPALVHGTSLSIEPSGPTAPSSTLDHPIYQHIDAFMNAHWPDRHGPLFVPKAATDARFFRGSGIASYGFSPFLILSTDTLQMKGANERMALPAFLDGVDLYVELVRSYVTNGVSGAVPG